MCISQGNGLILQLNVLLLAAMSLLAPLMRESDGTAWQLAIIINKCVIARAYQLPYAVNMPFMIVIPYTHTCMHDSVCVHFRCMSYSVCIAICALYYYILMTFNYYYCVALILQVVRVR